MSISSKAIGVVSTVVSLYQIFFSRPDTSNNQQLLKQLNKFFTSSMICVAIVISFITCSVLLIETTVAIWLYTIKLEYFWIAAILLGINLVFLIVTIYCLMRTKKAMELTYASHPELINSTIFLAKQLLK